MYKYRKMDRLTREDSDMDLLKCRSVNMFTRIQYFFNAMIEIGPQGRVLKKGSIYNIDIPALISTLDKTNRIFHILFSGYGEPFLVPNMIEACAEITKKHYVSFTTNLVSSRIKELLEKVDPQKVISIHASLHIKELERKSLLDRYVDNYLLCREKGIRISAVAVAYPALIGEADKYREFFKKKGIDLEFGVFKGVYNGKTYPRAYTEQELAIFRPGDIACQGSQRGRICNAGYNAAMVGTNGDVLFCCEVQEKLGSVYTGFQFKDKLIMCPADSCCCPINIFCPDLLEKALKETTS